VLSFVAYASCCTCQRFTLREGEAVLVDNCALCKCMRHFSHAFRNVQVSSLRVVCPHASTCLRLRADRCAHGRDAYTDLDRYLLANNRELWNLSLVCWNFKRERRILSVVGWTGLCGRSGCGLRCDPEYHFVAECGVHSSCAARHLLNRENHFVADIGRTVWRFLLTPGSGGSGRWRPRW
jgi:hypothetical protein